jgi:hypothetical protein
MSEKIVGVVDGLELCGITTIIRYIAFFTDERIIILKATKGNWLWIFSGTANETVSIMEDKEALEKLKLMDVDKIINTDYEKIIINKEELISVRLLEWPVLFRSKIIFNQGGKKYVFKAVRNVFKNFKKYSLNYKGISPILVKNNFVKILIAVLTLIFIIASIVSYSYLALSIK